MSERRINKINGTLIEDNRVSDILKDLKDVEDSKQNKLIAGEGIKIEDNEEYEEIN